MGQDLLAAAAKCEDPGKFDCVLLGLLFAVACMVEVLQVLIENVNQAVSFGRCEPERPRRRHSQPLHCGFASSRLLWLALLWCMNCHDCTC